jgi:uncharacterized protein YecT (DUF1311 family)
MKSSLRFLSFCCYILAGVSGLAADAKGKWLVYRPVAYQESHDPSMIWLQDKTQLEVRFGQVSYEEVDRWKPGRKLAFAYRSDTGPVLLDLQTGHTLPVVSGWSKHPLDEYLEKLDALEGNTAEMVTAQADAAALWKKEMTRAYNDLKSRSKPSQAKQLETAQSRWEQFKEAELAFLRSLNDEDAGTIGTVVAASRVTELYRRRALELADR